MLATNHPDNQRKYHCEKLGEVLVCLKKDGWKLNERKCEFMKSEIDVLGHRVTHNQLQVTPSYAAEMDNWPEPSSKKELQRFIGFVGFYAKFIPQYSEIAAPLTSLTGSAKFVFADAERNAFETLKKLVISRPVLVGYQPNIPVTLTTDASGTGWDAVLEQDEHPVEFASGKWTPTEKRYSTTKRELKAMLMAVKNSIITSRVRVLRS